VAGPLRLNLAFEPDEQPTASAKTSAIMSDSFI
jgi:hypothetical protein